MAPRSSSSSATTPYPRRSPAQPKSSRQQFSACGACRMRRVRCDLKDLPSDPTSTPSTCSNCKERGLKCVDEFADVKTVKLLRRGRRLQQVEAIYGKASGSDFPSPPHPLRPQSIIPQLQPEFFSSSFWRRFCVQRPIIDPAEFPTRFNAHHNGTHSLSPEGRFISMLLVIWAFSFGVDERGVEQSDGDQDSLADSAGTLQRDECVSVRRRERKERTNAMVREVLQLVDSHSIMRKPSWDGVRVLLLLLPLMEDGQLPLEVLTTYEATLAQINGLASLALLTPPLSHHSNSPSVHAYTTDAIVKARVFWYAYVHEGITTGLRGGRLMMDEVDLETFQKTLPTFDSNATNPQSFSVLPPFPSGSANFQLVNSRQGSVSHHQQQTSLSYTETHSVTHPQQPQQSGQLSPIRQTYLNTAQLFSVPLRLSTICRKVHTILTGRDARRKADRGIPIDSDGVHEVWAGLDACWDEFETIRRNAVGIAGEEVERYVGSWQIFVFECHNIVRDAIKQHIISQSPPGRSPHPGFPSHPTPPPSSAQSAHRLHTLAVRRCMKLLPLVLRIVKMHLHIAGTPLFKWDTGVIGDGCFFAGFLAAGGENASATEDVNAFGDCTFKQEDADAGLSHDEGVELCLLALREMRWTFAKAEEREQTIRMVRAARRAGTRLTSASDFSQHGPLDLDCGYNPYTSHTLSPPYPQTIVPLAPERPLLPPVRLTLASTEALINAPGTASTPQIAGSDGSGSWPVYTPPGTGTSGSGSTFSGPGGSPVYSALSGGQLQMYPKDMATDEEVLYPTHAGIVDMDPFSFSVPVSGFPHQRGLHEQNDACGWRFSDPCRCL